MNFKKIRHNTTATVLLVILITICRGLTASAQEQSIDNSLKIGDKAPALEAVWLKNKPKTTFGDGKVHVVEFWATWCNPCRMGMPHLSKMAQKYKGQVVVSAIDVWERSHQKDKSMDPTSRVKSFVDNSHDMLDCSVGMDTEDEKIVKTWLRPKNGLPTAYVIDQYGTIVWIGSPFGGLYHVVPLVLAGKFNEAERAKIRPAYQARLAEHRKFQKEAEDALKAGDYMKAITAADAANTVEPVFDDYIIPIKYEALDRMDREKGRAYARELMNGSHKNAPVLLILMWARRILDEQYKNPDYQIALELMQAGMRCTDFGEGFQAEMLAKAYAKVGDLENAVKIQAKIVKSMDDPVREVTPQAKEIALKKMEDYKRELKNANDK
ncbi:TlpA disulfide reductase family protein [Pedobacter frigoris]|uniref:TlpA disulfide reductase family protein n=1 Tax=Pedobacter frigoris TaxID=2571272 RepID=UPI00292F28D0|nr:TlpA disulfide reductase family protein [Pedobacter frigoris]